jgi:hypothetical protein
MYFKRASRIAEKSKDFDWRQLAETKIALADYYTFTESQNRSRKIYKQVWYLLSTDEERLALRNELFSDPVAIRTESLPLYAGGLGDSGSSRKDLLAGKIIVNYGVSTRGRVSDLKTEAIPAEFTDMQRMVHREIRRRIFRPRLVDGVTVESEGLIYEHAFSYVQSDLDALRAARTPADSKQEADDKQQNTDSD